MRSYSMREEGNISCNTGYPPCSLMVIRTSSWDVALYYYTEIGRFDREIQSLASFDLSELLRNRRLDSACWLAMVRNSRDV